MALISSGSVGATAPAGPDAQKGDPVGLKEYDVEINGQRTTLQLSDEDAKLYGLTKANLSSSTAAKAAKAQEAADSAAAEAKAREDAEAAAAAEKERAEVEAKEKEAAANKAAEPPANKAVSASQSKRDEAVGRAMNKPTKADG